MVRTEVLKLSSTKLLQRLIVLNPLATRCPNQSFSTDIPSDSSREVTFSSQVSSVLYYFVFIFIHFIASNAWTIETGCLLRNKTVFMTMVRKDSLSYTDFINLHKV